MMEIDVALIAASLPKVSRFPKVEFILASLFLFIAEIVWWQPLGNPWYSEASVKVADERLRRRYLWNGWCSPEPLANFVGCRLSN